jgi:hypothetical protein
MVADRLRLNEPYCHAAGAAGLAVFGRIHLERNAAMTTSENR